MIPVSSPKATELLYLTTAAHAHAISRQSMLCHDCASLADYDAGTGDA